MEFTVLHCKSQTKKAHTAGLMMAEIVQIQEYQDVTHQKAKYAKEQTFHFV
jgi:hypothetical protein